MQKTYYQILGVTPASNKDQIIAAHMKAVAKLMESGIDDPDSNALLDAALETLTDEGARASYDAALAAQDVTPRLGAVRTTQLQDAAHGGEPDTAAPPSRTMKSLAAFVAAVLLTLLAGWFLLPANPPAPPAPTPATQENAAAANAPSAEPAADAAGRSDSTKVPDPKPRTAEQVFTDASHSVVKVIVADGAGNVVGTGSGVVIARQTVITNCHVVLRGPEVTVKTLKDAYEASVTVADESYDLCRLDVQGLAAPAAELGSVQYVRTGQKVYAIGAPQGLELTISEGIVSALRETPMGNVIQTTAPISPGSSGGGLFNVNAQLIGITTFQHRTGQNLNFAVPADWISGMTTRSGAGPIPR